MWKFSRVIYLEEKHAILDWQKMTKRNNMDCIALEPANPPKNINGSVGLRLLKIYTLPETDSKSPWKWMVGILVSFWGWPIFRGFVSFREGRVTQDSYILNWNIHTQMLNVWHIYLDLQPQVPKKCSLNRPAPLSIWDIDIYEWPGGYKFLLLSWIPTHTYSP